MLHHKVLLQLS